MSNQNLNYVWEARLDNKYHCTVTRLSERTGELKIVNEENKQVLLQKEVNLAFGALFGPDIDDVLDWEQMCINAVDN